MDTGALRKFAQSARNLLISQVAAKLDLVLDPSSAARREHPSAVRELENAIRSSDRKQVIEQVAYTWFNRFTALRFMDACGYTNPRVVSPADGQTRPEILSEAMSGSVPDGASPQIAALLSGRSPSNDPQAEAYRLLLVQACNQWHGPMPFMFEEIDDYTELLMPEDLLSQTSILAQLRKVMNEEACQDVEIIGWLYQFYISEKKDQVFAGLKKNQKITAENIPAATQLFTPHWIVRYLVENSLGRLWLLNRPQSKLAARMDYYIAPEEAETDFLKIRRPEDIRICDPACGSGHMLTYAFDLLYAIYEEEGYEATEIPGLILTHNLTGIEIDDRAGALAAFALAMKAAAKLGRRRFLRMEAKPDICVLQNVTFTDAEMQDVAAVVGRDMFTDELRVSLQQFEQAKNFGSLIVPKLRDPAETLRVVEARDLGSDLLLKEVQARVVAVLRMAETLLPKYHVVVANPPYMGSAGMNAVLKSWIEKHFKAAKLDAMTCFMDRATKLTKPKGAWGMINLPSWLFLGSYSKFRTAFLLQNRISSFLHLGRGVFGPDFGSVAFVASRIQDKPQHRGCYLKLYEQHSLVRTPEEIQRKFLERDCEIYLSDQNNFLKIPGAPVAYWHNSAVYEAFEGRQVSQVARPMIGIQSGDNDRFYRQWQEVCRADISTSIHSMEDTSDRLVWAPLQRGGDARKWYGNNSYVVNLSNSASDIKSVENSSLRNSSEYFQECVSWNRLSNGRFYPRHVDKGFAFDDVSPFLTTTQEATTADLLACLGSSASQFFVRSFSTGYKTEVGHVAPLPLPNDAIGARDWNRQIRRAVHIARSDWDAYETSWDFSTHPLLRTDRRAETLEDSYAALRTYWQGITVEMQRLEEENNRIFIDAYGLQDELTPEVPVEEITLICNPAHRYGGKANQEELEARLRADTMAEFLSYAVGCMFGRYSLDGPGLILANQGETLADYLARVPQPSFMPDEDNVIPVLDGDWFPDDITERFRLFLSTTFGAEKLQENLRFIEKALDKDVRKYFTRDFYNDHVRRYKKRPIYWMFSSPKGSFNALIYMHRYRPDTVSVVLNEYLREFITKLETERARLEQLADDASASQSQRTKALKDVTGIIIQIDELTKWEREVMFPLAQKQLEIDLDDGVKANYPLFGDALKPIKGLEAADE
ncbi:hypothetical protein DFR52_101508 [Hoeflea marina]|uniref:site-specific DNA-methyltransferase (adenine-specific) n=1 Tax=Hoeflea marina TaxID=274592 RepID=A0A317PWH2_9HYPH|nr:BREX-1 system adenine-specific DNA-methyltransferase PglX [Hoeflea marina]PWW03820.1 hypothetical protein DFR52_101508 [Hoeflea marina]